MATGRERADAAVADAQEAAFAVIAVVLKDYKAEIAASPSFDPRDDLTDDEFMSSVVELMREAIRK